MITCSDPASRLCLLLRFPLCSTCQQRERYGTASAVGAPAWAAVALQAVVLSACLPQCRQGLHLAVPSQKPWKFLELEPPQCQWGDVCTHHSQICNYFSPEFAQSIHSPPGQMVHELVTRETRLNPSVTMLDISRVISLSLVTISSFRTIPF